jgi:NDP-sugar pyrophosphorylase family protein
MKAIILSAGFGTRLSPYTDTLPKALIPYKKIPMINLQIERLKKEGIDEIVVNTHHHSEKLEDYFSKKNFGIKISLIRENKILGTGGGILNAREYFKDEEYFLVMNVDIDTDMYLQKIISYHRSVNPFATLAVQKRKTKRYLEFDSDMKLAGRQNENSKEENLFAFNGIHIISNRIFEKGFEIEFRDILEIYFDVIRDGKEFISGFDAGKSYFKDLGKVENLES